MQRVIAGLREFLRLEAASGILLLGAALLAMLCANTPLRPWYDALLDVPVSVRVGALEVAKPLVLWINDGLMAVFFCLVGLELKRELLEGELADSARIALPLVGAVGGMAAPALVYVWINQGDSAALRGWAIPAATDIAFALGVLAVLGTRVPLGLKLFLMSLAIFDDLGAIVIIALFYTADLSTSSLSIAGTALVGLIVLNRRGVTARTPYVLLGLVMWLAVLKSGVHATLAGVALALCLPLRGENGASPLRELEHDLHPTVAYGVLPLFAFANAGVALTGLEAFLTPVPLGIALGLLVGKPLGVFGLVWLAVGLRLISRPPELTWGALFGVALLCGIGFTMSLFVGSLAFEQGGPDYEVADRLGILVGSLGSALAGVAVLHFVLPRQRTVKGMMQGAGSL